jgi:osmotically-inducible protein OsmY
MKPGVIVLILASSIAVVACTNSESLSKSDRTAGSGSAGTTGANPNAANGRDGAAPTPADQGSSAAETEITASIRKGMMADEKLSFNVNNVKVSTVGSKVTLRGPVETHQARSAIGDLASRTAGVSEVDNQLEVVKSKSSSN